MERALERESMLPVVPFPLAGGEVGGKGSETEGELGALNADPRVAVTYTVLLVPLPPPPLVPTQNS